MLYNPETEKTARKLTGSYYTPREIVNYMVEEALIAYLEHVLVMDYETGMELNLRTAPSQGKMFSSPDPVQTRLTPTRKKIHEKLRKEIHEKLRHLFEYNEEQHRFDRHEVGILIDAIDNIKILDPACGSGAFPMGILHRLVHTLGRLDKGNKLWKAKQIAKAAEIPDSTVRERVFEEIEKAFECNELDYGRKLYLIENCIYGVDIQPIAVQIARLRFFISLVVEQRIDDRLENRGILPLPNLETNFVAANSLIGIEGPEQRTIRNLEIDQKEKELAEVRRRHFTARTPKTKAKYRALDKQLRYGISGLLKEWGFPHETTEKLAYYDPYDQNASADYFDPEWMFGVTKGFDVTIGNPPYVRADSGEKHLSLRKTIEQSKQYETLWEKWDLYVPFIERSYKLLKPYGFTTLIVSDAFCHSKYAQKSQEWFLKNSRVLRLDFFSKIKIFDAAVHNITYLFQRADGRKNKPERRVHDPEFGVVRILSTSDQEDMNYRAFFPEDTLIKLVHVPTLPLNEICYITKGMVVHSNEKLAQGQFRLKDLISDKKDKLHTKPFVEGKNIGRWIAEKHNWIEWGTERAPTLFSRPTFSEFYEVSEKIISVDMAAGMKMLKLAYDDAQLYHNHSAWSFVPWCSLAGVRNKSLKKSARYKDEKPPRPDLPRREDLEKKSRRFAVKCLLSIMNSTIAHYFLRANRRSNIHLYPNDWKQLPVPDVSPEQQTPLIKLVDDILIALRANPGANITSLEAEIDAYVAHLYKITEDEYSLILSETQTPAPFRVAALNAYRDLARGF